MTMFARLFLLIGLVSGLSLCTVGGLLWLNSVELERQLGIENREAGARVLKKGTRLLEDDLRTKHQIIIREKARKVEAYLANIAGTIELGSTLISQFLGDTGSTNDVPTLYRGNDLTHRAKADPVLNTTVVGVTPYTIFHLAPGVTAQATANTRNKLRRLGGYFLHTQHYVPGCDSTYFGSREGFIQGYPGGESLFKPNYDPRRRPWYQAAISKKDTVWIVNLDRNGEVFLTCARPVTLPSIVEPAGVVAIDVRIAQDLHRLLNVENLGVSRAMLVDNQGQVLVDEFYGKVDTNKHDLLDMPNVEKLPERGFGRAVAKARNNPSEPSGIFFEGDEMAKTQSVFIYARIGFSGNETVSGSGVSSSSQNWYYVVQLPMDLLLKSVRDMNSEINNSTHHISNAIQVRTRKSAAYILGLIGVTLLAALTVAYFAARSTSRPLIQMAKVARGVGQGNLQQQAVETSGGEIGELGRAINAMISGLKQRDLLKETFGRYVAPTVVDEVLRQGDVQLGGVKRTVTIFFSDLQGFTALSEITTPETLIQLLNEYLDAMTKVILSSEGTLDKYIGDAILAFWGEPVAHEDDAARACRAALDQWKALENLCDEWAKEGRPALNMRIGIETGEVIVGNVGSELKYNYTVLGDTVNFASRLESLNKQYGTRIMIGEVTRQLAGDAIEVREIDLLAVAGKNKPIRVYELLAMAGEITPEQRAGHDLYEQGLAAYRRRQWDEATDYLLQAQSIFGSDKPTEVLLSRIEACRINEPDPQWDGSFFLDKK